MWEDDEKRNYFKQLDRRIDKELTHLLSNPNLERTRLFFSNLSIISQEYDLSIFKDKCVELNEMYNLSEFKDIDFSEKPGLFLTFFPEPMITGDVSKKRWRKCDTLKEYECNEECFFESAPFIKFWSKGTCRPRDIGKLIYNTFCSERSYKGQEELVDILKVLDPMAPYTVHTLRSELCDALRKLTVEISKNVMKEDQHLFWNKIGVSARDLKETILVLQDCYTFKRSFYATFTRVYSFILRHKSFLKRVANIITLIVTLYYFIYPSVSSYLGQDTVDQDVLAEVGISADKLGSHAIEWDTSVAGDIKNYINSSGYSLEAVAGDDRVIDISDVSKVIRYEKFRESGDFCEFFEGKCATLGENVPKVIQSSIRDLESNLDYLRKQAMASHTLAREQMKTAIKYMEVAISTLRNYNFSESQNPWDTVINKVGAVIQDDYVPLVDMIPVTLTPTEKVIQKIQDTTYEKVRDKLLTRSFRIVEEYVAGKIAYFVIEGIEWWMAGMAIDPEMQISASVIKLPEGKTIEEFIEATKEVPAIEDE